MMDVGESLERDLEDVAREARLPFGLAAAKDVRELSDAYNDLRPLRTRGALAARLAFFFARDARKSELAARELRAARLLDGPQRVLDLGAGLGASALGIPNVMEATLVDDDRDALELASKIAARRGVRVRVEVCDVDRYASSDHDLVVAQNILAELRASPEEDADRLERWLSFAKPSGSLVVIEPALKSRARHLHAVRDALAARGVPLFAPCLHARACPALAREGDWCHEDLPVDLPSWLVPLAKAAGLRWQGLTFAYLVLRRDGETLGARAGRDGARVVSGLIRTKGKREARLCGAHDGVAVRLDRDKSANNATFERLARGDLVRVTGAVTDGDRLRVVREARVSRIAIDDALQES